MATFRLERIMSVLQWFVFLVINSMLLPLMIGEVFQLAPPEITGMIQRMFFVVGLSSLLACWFGHRLPIAEGAAGIWLSIFILTAGMAKLQGNQLEDSLRLLEGGMILAGVIVILIGAAGWTAPLMKVFTPLVTGIYLILLAIMLTGSFLQGMLGLGAVAEPPPAGIPVSFAVFALVIVLSVWGRGWMKSFALLLGVLSGWTALVLINGWNSGGSSGAPILSVPKLLAWGMPKLDSGMATTAFLAAFVVLSSVIASVAAMRQVTESALPDEAINRATNRGSLFGGLSNLLAGLFSTVGPVQMAISAGFVKLTGQAGRGPFMAGCLALIAVSFFPGIYAFLSVLPAGVAYAALLASYTQMIGIGLRSLQSEPFDDRRLAIIGTALSSGTAVMFLPSEALAALPLILRNVLSNGVMVGMLMALLIERLWRKPPV